MLHAKAFWPKSAQDFALVLLYLKAFPPKKVGGKCKDDTQHMHERTALKGFKGRPASYLTALFARMDAPAAAANDVPDRVLDPWVTWRQNGSFTFGRLSHLQSLIAERPVQRAHTQYKQVSHLQESLFSFLNAERENRTELFRNRGRVPLIDFFPWIVRQVCFMFFHLSLFKDRNPLEVCCEVTVKCLRNFERGMMGGSRTFNSNMPKKFAELLRREYSFLNGMRYREALLIAHMRMLVFIQDKTRYLERRHGRLQLPSIAESYAIVFAQSYPTLYAQHIAPMFPAVIYGRTAKVPSVVEDE